MQEYLATELAFKNGEKRGMYEIIRELIRITELSSTSADTLVMKLTDFLSLFDKFDLDESKIYDKRL